MQAFEEKVINKSVSEMATVPEVEPVVPNAESVGNSKKAIWKFIIQTLINILTAILTALGTTSCVSHL